MALDLGCIGLRTSVHEYACTWKTTVLYALGIGAKRGELDYLYEGRGPRVYPTFAVVPVYPALMEAMARTGGNLDNIVHGHQKVTMHREIPPEAQLRTTATIEKIYDLRKMAQVILSTRTTDAAGESIFDTEWGVLVLGEGGFNGDAPPQRETETPKRPCDFRTEETTSTEQALLYRLMGDGNPLHVDPTFRLVERFKGVPILHGLCTYGFNARAVIRHACGGDGAKIKQFSARFSKPVWPGDTLVTEGWIDGLRVFTRSSTRERAEAVLTQGYAVLTE